MRYVGILVVFGCLVACHVPEQARFVSGAYEVQELDYGRCYRRLGKVATATGSLPPSNLSLDVAGEADGALAASAGSAGYRVAFPDLGFDIDVNVLWAGMAAHGNVWLAQNSQIGVAVAEGEDRRLMPGFFYGLDLRSYRSLVFVIDTSEKMCARKREPGPYGSWVQGPGRFSGKYPQVNDEALDHVVAAIAGMPLDRILSLVTSDRTIRHLVPKATAAGRQLAMEWACSLPCGGDTALGLALLRALEEKPEVIVLISNGGIAPVELFPDAAERQKFMLPMVVDPLSVLESAEWTVPIIAAALPGGEQRMRRIAELSGGAFVGL